MPFKSIVITLITLVGFDLVRGQIEVKELEKAAERRSIDRFTLGNPDNHQCWDRNVDGFFSVVDAHNHFRPFGGPEVPFDDYLDWMKRHGIVFSTVFGIGQKIKKKNPDDPDCCYYLHCPTLNYTVVPDPRNDFENAKDVTEYKKRLVQDVHLTLSATFPNFQKPTRNVEILENLMESFPGQFAWVGESNIYKHALVANGFFDQPKVTEQKVYTGVYDDFFAILAKNNWPATLHCDIGCDNYDHIPFDQFNISPVSCEVPAREKMSAEMEHSWWKELLGHHYHGFFDEQNKAKENFKKIQHLKLWDTILERYPGVNIVWAHMGLSKELKRLHPVVHVHIMKKLLTRYQNLYADISWDILAKMVFMNYKSESISDLGHENHEDLTEAVPLSFFDQAAIESTRTLLHTVFEENMHLLHDAGSGDQDITGPTHALAIYLELFHEFSDRFLTGTDFVASFGEAELYPGLKVKGTGCKKDEANYARQLTDTSAINMFFDDTAFRRIVLGENYFKLTRTDDKYAPPPICPEDPMAEG